MSTSIWRRLLATVATGVVAAASSVTVAVAPATPAAAADGPNLAAGQPMSESSHTDVYPAGNANDGNQSSYWESANHAFPQWLQVDLGASVSVEELVLKLPPAGWEARTQTLEVQGSTSGSSFPTLVASAPYPFDPATGNTVSIRFDPVTTRFVRVHITGNTGWPAGQVSELEVYGPAGGDTEPPTPPTNLTHTEPQSDQIQLSWDPATDNVGVTDYDIYANGELLTSVGGTVLSYLDTQPPGETVSYFVRARDAAGNQSANSNTVTRTGQTGDTEPPSAPTDLAFSQPSPTQITLTWDAATDNVGVTGYDIYRNGALIDSVTGTVLSYTDTQPASATVTYHVQARDGAGNQSPPSNSVTRTTT